jgi:hypothetical protein
MLLERELGQLRFVLGHADLVDHLAVGQVFQRPGQVLRVDALHRRAHADGGRHELDDLACGFTSFGQAVDQVELGADQPARAGAALP